MRSGVRRALASWWLRVWRPHFCFDCDKSTWLHHEHVGHLNRPGRSR